VHAMESTLGCFRGSYHWHLCKAAIALCIFVSLAVTYMLPQEPSKDQFDLVLKTGRPPFHRVDILFDPSERYAALHGPGMIIVFDLEEHWEKDPDRRVQQAVLSVFGKFLELGTVRQTLLWFLEHGLQLPVYTQQGETCWKRPTYATIYRILTNPIYGGAYAYGKTEHTLHYENGEPRRGARRKPKEQWLALIPNAHEGYVSWEQHQQIRQAITENARGGEHSGLVQGGAALLPGLLRCRRCGRKLTVLYTGNHHNVLRYECRRGWLDYGEPRCIGFGGMPVDEALAQEVLRVVQPAAVEAAILASEEEARKQDEVLEALGRDLEAARYAAQRAQKQYDAADPENRLVADELERRWNQALQRLQEIERRIEQHVHGQGKRLQRHGKSMKSWRSNWRRCGIARIPIFV